MTPPDLSRRLVAAPGFRWMPRMRAIALDGDRWNVVLYEPNPRTGHRWLLLSGDEDQQTPSWMEASGMVPDLDDPATLGCIEHGLLPELYGGPVSLEFFGSWWSCEVPDGRHVATIDGRSFLSDWPTMAERIASRYPSIGEMLVTTVEAAPKRGGGA
jgi:hypothetical protein